MVGGSTTWSMGGIGHGRDPVWDGIHLGYASPASPNPGEDVQGLKVALWSIPATIINSITII